MKVQKYHVAGGHGAGRNAATWTGVLESGAHRVSEARLEDLVEI